ncbi:hypothetical protein DSECCO2_605800 [anaerobic digester metagenome]
MEQPTAGCIQEQAGAFRGAYGQCGLGCPEIERLPGHVPGCHEPLGRDRPAKTRQDQPRRDAQNSQGKAQARVEITHPDDSRGVGCCSDRRVTRIGCQIGCQILWAAQTQGRVGRIGEAEERCSAGDGPGRS